MHQALAEHLLITADVLEISSTTITLKRLQSRLDAFRFQQSIPYKPVQSVGFDSHLWHSSCWISDQNIFIGVIGNYHEIKCFWLKWFFIHILHIMRLVCIFAPYYTRLPPDTGYTLFTVICQHYEKRKRTQPQNVWLCSTLNASLIGKQHLFSVKFRIGSFTIN